VSTQTGVGVRVGVNRGVGVLVAVAIGVGVLVGVLVGVSVGPATVRVEVSLQIPDTPPTVTVAPMLAEPPALPVAAAV